LMGCNYTLKVAVFMGRIYKLQILMVGAAGFEPATSTV